jgi:hypothetical protein
VSTETQEIEWSDKKVYRQLYAAALFMLKSKPWARGENTDVFLLGKMAHDYVQDAICKYLQESHKYNPRFHRSRINYIKHHILRSLITADARREENLTSVVVKEYPSNENGDDTSLRAESLPIIEEYLGEQIDYDIIMARIAEEIKGDQVMENIFLGQCSDLQPREIMQEFKISPQHFHNGKRRLGTVISKIANEFHLKKKTA